MFATRHLHLAQPEVFKWLAILTAACVLAALAARLAAGEEATRPEGQPGLLPAAIEQLAKPMTVEPTDTPDTTPEPQHDDVIQVWRVLAQQKDGEFEHVGEPWKRAPLSCDAEVWRHVALGQAALALRDLKRASQSLETALTIDPQNAVAHYFRGLLRLEQAALADDWYDAVGPSHFRLASTGMPGEPSMTKSMYRLAARMDFESAIENAASVDFDQQLCAPHTPTTAALEPTVGDLLIVLRAEDFVGKSHHVLGYLLLEDGAGREAEQHLDQAAMLGQSILYGYQDLGALYEQQHEHLDAARAYAKALSHGAPIARPMVKILENLRQAIVNEF